MLGAKVMLLSRRRGLYFTAVLLFSATCLGSPQSNLSSPKSKDEHKPAVKHEDELYVAPEPVNCESFAAIVDTALVEWQDLKGTYFIVIARPGAQEKLGGLGRSRLGDVEFYIKQRMGREINYVTAEGSRTEGLGKIEI